VLGEDVVHELGALVDFVAARLAKLVGVVRIAEVLGHIPEAAAGLQGEVDAELPGDLVRVEAIVRQVVARPRGGGEVVASIVDRDLLIEAIGEARPKRRVGGPSGDWSGRPIYFDRGEPRDTSRADTPSARSSDIRIVPFNFLPHTYCSSTRLLKTNHRCHREHVDDSSTRYFSDFSSSGTRAANRRSRRNMSMPHGRCSRR